MHFFKQRSYVTGLFKYVNIWTLFGIGYLYRVSEFPEPALFRFQAGLMFKYLTVNVASFLKIYSFFYSVYLNFMNFI